MSWGIRVGILRIPPESGNSPRRRETNGCWIRIIAMEDVMRKRAGLYAICAILSLALAGVALADNHAIKLSEKDGVGKFLADSKGMTLYIFKKDSSGKSVCEGSCLVKWPLYFREKVSVPEGVNAGDFSAITRGDGMRQSTYKGSPLYYFAGDKAPGDVQGQGLGNVWFVANP
jgi:predicted lipoprotein with Yx(FWY)xxD motif